MPQVALADGPVDLTLTMTRTDGTGPLAVGGEAVVRLEVRNTGLVNATDVTVVATLPDGLTLIGASVQCNAARQVVTCAAGPIAAFDELLLDLRVRAEPSAAERTLTNVAIATAAEPLVATASNEASLEIQIGPYSALQATMSAAAASVAAGSSATFGATVRNDGPSAASGVRLIDLLPEGLRLRSATPSRGTCAGAVCDLGGLPAGASAQIQIVADVDLAAGGRRVNAVEVTATSPSRAARAEAAFEIRPAPAALPSAAAQAVDVAVRVRAPARATEGAAGAWRLEVVNNGRVTATGVTLTGAVSRPVDLVGAREAQVGCGSRLPFSCALGSLAAGQRRTFVLTLRPRAAGRLTLTARVAAAGAETARADNLGRARVRVAPGRARARLSVAAAARSVRTGGTVGFRISVRNPGRVTARRLEICGRPVGALELTRAPRARVRSDRACWRLPKLPPGATRRYRVTARALAVETPSAATLATLRGANVRRARARAGVRLLQRGGAAPIVTR